jgi:hypothetical protein
MEDSIVSLTASVRYSDDTWKSASRPSSILRSKMEGYRSEDEVIIGERPLSPYKNSLDERWGSQERYFSYSSKPRESPIPTPSASPPHSSRRSVFSNFSSNERENVAEREKVNVHFSEEEDGIPEICDTLRGSAISVTIVHELPLSGETQHVDSEEDFGEY